MKPATPTTPPVQPTHHDHNDEWDAAQDEGARHPPSDVRDRGVLDALGRAVVAPVLPQQSSELKPPKPAS